MFDHFFLIGVYPKISLQTGKQGPPMQKRTKLHLEANISDRIVRDRLKKRIVSKL